MIINQSKLLEKQHSKTLSLKTKFILVLLTLLALISSVFYYYFTSSKNQIQNAVKLESQSKLVNSEVARCNSLLAQDQGEFSEYEYCRKLLSVFTADQ